MFDIFGAPKIGLFPKDDGTNQAGPTSPAFCRSVATEHILLFELFPVGRIPLPAHLRRTSSQTRLGEFDH